jgi:hypothetical protein
MLARLTAGRLVEVFAITIGQHEDQRVFISCSYILSHQVPSPACFSFRPFPGPRSITPPGHAFVSSWSSLSDCGLSSLRVKFKFGVGECVAGLVVLWHCPGAVLDKLDSASSPFHIRVINRFLVIIGRACPQMESCRHLDIGLCLVELQQQFLVRTIVTGLLFLALYFELRCRLLYRPCSRHHSHSRHHWPLLHTHRSRQLVRPKYCKHELFHNTNNRG